MRRIVSIAASPGWSVRIVEDDDDFTATLAGWALVEEEGERRVVGLVQRSAAEGRAAGTIALADEVDGFAGYAFTGS